MKRSALCITAALLVSGCANLKSLDAPMADVAEDQQLSATCNGITNCRDFNGQRFGYSVERTDSFWRAHDTQ